MPRQTSVQVLPSTDRQAEQLKAAGFGNFTNVTRIAIDRLFREEILHVNRAPFGLLQKIAWCAHRLTCLEAVADYVSYYNSPAIQAKLYGIVQFDLAHVKGEALYGYDLSYGLVDSILERARKLTARLRASGKHELGDDDPAFEIARHLDNRWYGRREDDAYPNEVAERIMARYPVPYYLR